MAEHDFGWALARMREGAAVELTQEPGVRFVIVSIAHIGQELLLAIFDAVDDEEEPGEDAPVADRNVRQLDAVPAAMALATGWRLADDAAARKAA